VATIQNAYAYWEPGPKEAPVRGLFSVAEVYNVTDAHIGLGAEYQSNRCTQSNEWLDFCLPPDVQEWATLSLVRGDSFAVYDGLECDTAAVADPKEYESRLTDTFDVKAEATIEARFQQMLMTEAAIPAPSGSLLEMVSVLETELAANYAGRGTLHTDRFTSLALYGQKLIEDPHDPDMRVQTINGTPMSLGRGYVRNAGQYWAGAAGRVVILRGRAMFTATPPLADKPARFHLQQQVVLLAECVGTWSEVPTA